MHRNYYKPLPPVSHLARRLLRSALIASGFIVGALGLGMVGYHAFEDLSWLDAFLNASMILAGMGQVNELHTTSGKVFAGCYAIFSGVMFLTTIVVLLGPVAHRFLHRMHLEIEPEEKTPGEEGSASPKVTKA